MPIVAPGICRYSINQEYFGGSHVNVLDAHIDTGLGEARDESCFNFAGILINQWAADLMPKFNEGLRFLSVSWTDLNDDNGSTGERSSTDTVTLPASGGITTDAHPGSVCFLVRKSIQGRRGAKSGRMYVSGVSENSTPISSPNTLVGSTVTSINTSLAAFLGNVNQTTEGDAYQARLVVVHRPASGEVNYGFTNIEALEVDSRLASQRRRLRR